MSTISFINKNSHLLKACSNKLSKLSVESNTTFPPSLSPANILALQLLFRPLSVDSQTRINASVKHLVVTNFTPSLPSISTENTLAASFSHNFS